MISESQRRLMILEYVREHSVGSDKKITKSDVMRHLKEVRPMTTHKTIVELIKEGKIKMVKDKPYSQTDYLVLNENNEFNRINKALSEIMDASRKMMDASQRIDKTEQEKEKMKKLNIPELDFMATTVDLIHILNWFLLGLTMTRIKSEKDIRILFDKIIQNMYFHEYNMNPQREMLEKQISKIGKLVKSIKSKPSEYIKIDIQQMERFYQVLNDFDKNFLSGRRYKLVLK